MIINIADKGIKLDQKSLEYIYKHFQKINNLFPQFNPDILSLNFFIRKNDDRYYTKRRRSHIGKDYLKVKLSLAHFEGWIRLILPKKALYTHFKGADVEECIHSGIKSLTREIKKYKQLHFKSQSRYPDHSSIRGGKYAES